MDKQLINVASVEKYPKAKRIQYRLSACFKTAKFYVDGRDARMEDLANHIIYLTESLAAAEEQIEDLKQEFYNSEWAIPSKYYLSKYPDHKRMAEAYKIDQEKAKLLYIMVNGSESEIQNQINRLFVMEENYTKAK